MNAVAHKKRKGKGFTGEKIFEIPKDSFLKCKQMPYINKCFIVKMGLYPKAMHHYCTRPTGFSQVVLLYCTDGEGWIQFAKHKLILKAGTVVAIPTFTQHAYGANPQNPWTIYWFHFAGPACNELVQLIMGEKNTPKQTVEVSYSQERMTLFERISETFLKGYSNSNLLYANLSATYFLASITHPENFQSSNEKKIITPANKAIRFMQEHLAKPVSVFEIASAAQLSVSFFCRKFKQDTGYTPIQYYNHLRVQEACQLLHFTDYRISEIAEKIGIEDSFYFSRLFKKQLGVSPIEYRRRERLPS